MKRENLTNSLTNTLTHTDSVGNKQVLCLGPTVPAVPSLSSIIISNIFGRRRTTLFGGTAQTGGVGIVAAIIPPSTGVDLSTVPAAPCILVPVPGQAQGVSFILNFLIVSKFDLPGAELHPIVNSHVVSKG